MSVLRGASYQDSGAEHRLVSSRSPIIERYKTCSTPESVLEMQGVMMKELEAEQAENSALRVRSPTRQILCSFLMRCLWRL